MYMSMMPRSQLRLEGRCSAREDDSENKGEHHGIWYMYRRILSTASIGSMATVRFDRRRCLRELKRTDGQAVLTDGRTDAFPQSNESMVLKNS